MKLQGTDLVAITALAGAGCAALFLGLRMVMRRAVAERQRATEQQLNALAATVKNLQARVAELSRLTAERAGAAEIDAMSAAADEPAAPAKPEMLAALTAAATAFLGKRARIRSAKLVPAAPESSGAWAQQGRVVVQTSHNLRARG